MAHKKLETEGKEMKNVSQQTFYSPIWPKSTPVRLDDNAEEICKKDQIGWHAFVIQLCHHIDII